MYMDYCKFEGTLTELQRCMNDVEDHVDGVAEDRIFDMEIECFRRMVYEFRNWLHDMALLDDEGYIDKQELNNVCEAMKRGGRYGDD